MTIRIAVALVIAGGFFYAASSVDPGDSRADDDLAGRGPTLGTLPSGASSASSDAPPGPLLGTLLGRRHRVEITAASDEPRYTILDDQGEALAERLTLKQADLLFPGLNLGGLRFDTPPVDLGPDPLEPLRPISGAIMLAPTESAPY